MAGKRTDKNNPSAAKTAGGVAVEKKDVKALGLMEELGVKVLWENSKGEYFTEKSLAEASENGKTENIKEYKR